MHAISRRLMLLAAAGISIAAIAPALAQDQVTLRMVWWGSDSRTAATIEAIKLFEAQHPNIEVEAEAIPFDGYVDKLSTQIAANDAPDLIQLPVETVAQFANGGALLKLDKVDITNLDPVTTQAAVLDGQQVAVATGLATSMIIANKTLFDAAGVALPDDKSWTWDDYLTISKQISANGPEGTFGSQPFGMDGASFGNYLRQLGHDAYDAQGNITMRPADVVSYLEFAKKLWDENGSPGPEMTAELIPLPVEQSASATNKAAMGFWASSQFTAVANASGQELVPLRLPSPPATPGDSKMSVGVAQYWAASSRSQHPDETQALLDFIVNNVDAGKQLLIVRGMPPNTAVREAITPDLTPADAMAARYITELQPDTVSSYLPPAGFGIFQETFRRYTAEYLFGRLSAEDAAQQMIAEIKSGVGQ